MISGETKIRLTQKGAAWLALRESGLIQVDSVAFDERFELFWNNFSEYQMPVIHDLIERTEKATEEANDWKLKVAVAISYSIGMFIGALITAMVTLF